MKHSLSIKPKYLITFTLSLALILIAVTAMDIYQGQKELYNSKTTEAVSLIQAVQKAGENVFISNEEMERLIADKLLTAASFISNKKITSPAELNSISKETGIDHIQIYSSKKVALAGNETSEKSEFNLSGFDELDSLLAGNLDYFVYNALEDVQGSRHFALFYRLKSANSFILLLLESERLLDYRKKTGIGTLFRNIADAEEIRYLVIQDQDGIIVASKGINELNTIETDSFLTRVLAGETIASREHIYDNEKLLEVVKPFLVKDDVLGIIRIGISLESLNRLFRRSIIRSIIISAFLLLTGVIIFVLISNNQRYSILQDEYAKIQTYTGNILDNMSDGVITADHQGRINLINRAAENVFGVTSSQVIGNECKALIKSPETLIEQTIRLDQPVEYYEQMVITHNDKQLVIGGASSIIRDKDGNIDTVIAVIRDLTSIRQNEELQKRREKLTAMGELAGSVAHEIKNPLNSIGITIQRFQKEFVPIKDNDEYLELITTVKSEIKRVTEIINQFLAFAKPPRIDRQISNVKEFLAEICKSYETQAAASGVTLACSSQNVNWKLDISQMKQVMINLIQNAFDAVNSEGSIIIESFVNQNNLIITVSDNGTGIRKEDQTKIFNLYFTTKQNGTGFGLSIVNQIVQEHNGTIKVESEKNKGTKFIIEIPQS